MKPQTPSKSCPEPINHLRQFVLLLALLFASSVAQTQTPYDNFINPMFIPDTLSTWPLGEHSRIHLDITEDSLVLFPNASPNNPAVPGFAYRTADNLPIRTLAYSNPNTHNPGILGPTLIWWAGDSVTMEVENQLHHSTTTHWHGAHVAPGNDGGPHQVIEHHEIWEPSFQIRDNVSTLWYHPHLHHHTMEQVQRGMAGIIIVKNASDTIAGLLPHDYGVNDFPIILQDKYVQYDPVRQRDTINWCCSLGTIPLVNGTWKPTTDIPDKGLVRFRILNGSSERVMAISLQRGSDPNNLIPFQVIASDAGYLNNPYTMNESAPNPIGDLSQTLIIMGSERYEIVFDAAALNGEPAFLVNRRDWMMGSSHMETFAGGPSYGNPGCYSGPYPGMPLPWQIMTNYVCLSDSTAGWMVPTADFDSLPMPLLKIMPVSMPGAPMVMSLPSTLANWQIPSASSASVTRIKNLLGFNPGSGPPFSIDGVNFDLTVINDFIHLGATEIWDVYNSSGVAHPFHVHDIHFFITEIQDFDAFGNMTPIPVPPYLQGPKDVMPVASNSGNHPFSGTLYPQAKYRLIGQWEDFGVPINTDSLYNYAYMYHCHILDHEDGGMMHQFVVVSPTPSDTDTPVIPAPGDWLIYPNPSQGIFNLRGTCDAESKIEVLDITGRTVARYLIPPIDEHQSVTLPKQLPNGIYMVNWVSNDRVSSKTLMVQE